MRHLIDYGNALYMSDMLRAFIDAKYDKVFSILQEHAVSPIDPPPQTRKPYDR